MTPLPEQYNNGPTDVGHQTRASSDSNDDNNPVNGKEATVDAGQAAAYGTTKSRNHLEEEQEEVPRASNFYLAGPGPKP